MFNCLVILPHWALKSTTVIFELTYKSSPIYKSPPVVVIPPAPARVTATPTDGPVNETAPPTYRFSSIPVPPSTTNDPVSLLAEPVVLEI